MNEHLIRPCEEIDAALYDGCLDDETLSELEQNFKRWLAKIKEQMEFNKEEKERELENNSCQSLNKS